jgi:hypothetical protein
MLGQRQPERRAWSAERRPTGGDLAPDAFYEWRAMADGKQPHAIARREGGDELLRPTDDDVLHLWLVRPTSPREGRHRSRSGATSGRIPVRFAGSCRQCTARSSTRVANPRFTNGRRA